MRLPSAPLAAAILALGVSTDRVCVAPGARWPSVFGVPAFVPTILRCVSWLDPLRFALGLAAVAVYGLATAAVATLGWNAMVGRTTAGAPR